VNNHSTSWVASHQFILKMIQSLQSTNFIGRQRLIHSNPIQRMLRSICQNASLSEQFADIYTSIVIPVYNESTGLTNIGFVNNLNYLNLTKLRELAIPLPNKFGSPLA